MKTTMVFFTLVVIVLAGCTVPTPTAPPLVDTPQGSMANPATVYCEQQGYQSEMLNFPDGSQGGVCLFPDGSECEEWAFFRGECQPGMDQKPPEVIVTPRIVEPTPGNVASDGCSIYLNTEYGYSFHYPASASVESNTDPLGGISIVGPVKNGETWPAISISHPYERAEFRPPENTDLAQWLGEHNLVGEKRMDDMQLAGTTALHYRHDRSPQSYASDSFFFAVKDQLFRVDILHTGDREDWALYNHILESIEFK